MGQEPLKVELDEFCEKKGIKPISVSTIARIIRYLKDKGLIFDTKKKVSFYAKTGKVVIREKKKKKKLRRKGYTPSDPGDLVQMDSLHVFINGIKRYIFSAIDLKTRFAFAYTYKSFASDNAKDFRDPKSNAYIERFNRTLQEHFIEWYSEDAIEPEKFNKNLIKYLTFL